MLPLVEELGLEVEPLVPAPVEGLAEDELLLGLPELLPGGQAVLDPLEPIPEELPELIPLLEGELVEPEVPLLSVLDPLVPPAPEPELMPELVPPAPEEPAPPVDCAKAPVATPNARTEIVVRSSFRMYSPSQ